VSRADKRAALRWYAANQGRRRSFLPPGGLLVSLRRNLVGEPERRQSRRLGGFPFTRPIGAPV